MTTLSQAKALCPALKIPATSTVLSVSRLRSSIFAFTNTLSREDSDAAWEKYAIPAPGNWVWAYELLAKIKPGRQETWVDYSKDRAPFPFIGGEKDHIMPPAVNKSNAKHYAKSPALTECHEFAGARSLDMRIPRAGGSRRFCARMGHRACQYTAP